MNTPICDFVNSYASKCPVRMHMPGHKGASLLGMENIDITEIAGADDLYHPSSIILKSEANASSLFGCPTYYSTEGSSQCIRAMLYLCVLKASATNVDLNSNSRPLVLAGRNSHQTFLTAAALLDLDVKWLYGSPDSTYLSLDITPEYIRGAIEEASSKPVCVYLTSPDYLGNIVDVKGIAAVCHEYGVPLAIDNAHGAYLKFLPEGSLHPIDLGADICCDSAHKTLPVLTGGAYLHISNEFYSSSIVPGGFDSMVKSAMAMFGSTSPSWIILQSLDKANEVVGDDSYRVGLMRASKELSVLCEKLQKIGFNSVTSEPLKLVIKTLNYGYEGDEIAEALRLQGIECEFSDRESVVLMASPMNDSSDFDKVYDCLKDLPAREAISAIYPSVVQPETALSIREATMKMGRLVPVDEAIGCVAGFCKTSCPPAVPIVMSGEVIDASVVECLKAFEFDEIYIV